MEIGFIVPNYPAEKRVALLPEHIDGFPNKIIIEKGFGNALGINDSEYVDKGCTVVDGREEVFDRCKVVFSLKLIQPSDYTYLKPNQMIVGWTHPFGSGSEFMAEQVRPKNLIIFDLDNINPSIYYKDQAVRFDAIPSNFVYKNSVNAGYASVLHALMSHGLFPVSDSKIAILSPGNVSQGAFMALAKFSCQTRMFYRKTLPELKRDIHQFDIIVNGIENDVNSDYILNRDDLKKTKKGCLIIDAAADAGYAIEGGEFTTFEKPITQLHHNYYYCINNTPTIFYRKASFDISESFSKYVYSINFKELYNQFID